MATRIRLARRGKKGYPFYHIIIADKRNARDGKFIEKIGTYNPNTNPATVELEADRALYWLNVGAEPSSTCKNILSWEGILLKKHLQAGVKKGAFTEEVSEQKFQAWISERDTKLSSNEQKVSADADAKLKASLDAETKVRQAHEAKHAERRMAEVAEKNAEAVTEETPEVEEAEVSAETVSEEPTVKEEPAVTETPAEEETKE